MPFFPPPPPGFEIDFRGLDIIRGRDCVIFLQGDTTTVTVDDLMIQNGWPGGQGVQWVFTSPDDRVVTYSRGLYGGFLLVGSDESADQYTAMTGQELKYKEAVLVAGRALMSTIAYERYTYASRTGGGPLVPIVYKTSDPLYFSLRGYWTNEDELTLSGDPQAPAFFTGFVAQIPKVINRWFLGIQTSL